MGRRLYDRGRKTRFFEVADAVNSIPRAARRAELIGFLDGSSWKVTNTFDPPTWGRKGLRTWERKLYNDDGRLVERQQRQMDFVFVPRSWKAEASPINKFDSRCDHFPVKAIVEQWLPEGRIYHPNFGETGWRPVTDKDAAQYQDLICHSVEDVMCMGKTVVLICFASCKQRSLGRQR